MDFFAFSLGAPSSSHLQVCVYPYDRTWQDNVWQSKTMSWCFPKGPTLHRWCTSRADLGPYNVTGVRLLDSHHCPLRDPVVGSSPYVRCPCVLLLDTHHCSPRDPVQWWGPYVRCPSLVLSAPSSSRLPRDPHVQVGCRFSIELNWLQCPQLSPCLCHGWNFKCFRPYEQATISLGNAVIILGGNVGGHRSSTIGRFQKIYTGSLKIGNGICNGISEIPDF